MNLEFFWNLKLQNCIRGLQQSPPPHLPILLTCQGLYLEEKASKLSVCPQWGAWKVDERGKSRALPWGHFGRGQVTPSRICMAGCLSWGVVGVHSVQSRGAKDLRLQGGWAKSFGGDSGGRVIAWLQLCQENRPQGKHGSQQRLQAEPLDNSSSCLSWESS